jgi:hypothetical protein
VIVTRGPFPAGLPDVPVRSARVVVGPWRLGDAFAAEPPPLVAVVCGVARPGDVRPLLGTPVARLLALPDHAPVDGDVARRIVAFAGDLPLACTAKDRVRLPPELRAIAWWRDVGVVVDSPPETWFPESRGEGAQPRRRSPAG